MKMLSHDSAPSVILQQLGGNRFITMTGANGFIGGETDEPFLQFSFKGSRKANKCRITLNWDDTYTMEFYKYSPTTYEARLIDSTPGLYCEDIEEHFCHFTGLITKL